MSKKRPAAAHHHFGALNTIPQTGRRGRPLRVLEVCCGRGRSFSRVVRRSFPGAEIVTLDSSHRAKPDILADITEWRFLKHYPPGYFDIIWVSPPCTEYSPAKTAAARDLQKADDIVRAALRLIRDAEPIVWFLENPHTRLFRRDFMASFEHLRRTCTYCRYGFCYKKATDIWCNIELPPLKHCDTSPCQARATVGSHRWTAQAGPSGTSHTPGVPKAVADFVPPRLIRVLLSAARKRIIATSLERITWA